MLNTRFAPSPTGYLHLGHIYSALFARINAKLQGGRFLLRMENIDSDRCQPFYEDIIKKDLQWLGITWDGIIRRQSEHLEDYASALGKLKQMGVLYPCFCSRKKIQREVQESNRAPHNVNAGFEATIYPGICRNLTLKTKKKKIENGIPYALRLNIERANQLVGNIKWVDFDEGEIQATPSLFGDVVVARKDVQTSYHLAVTVDDHLQGINFVTRGQDLCQITHVHCLLQALLGYQTPQYRFHKLILNENGQKLSKRIESLSVNRLRDRGYTPSDIMDLLPLSKIQPG